MISVISEAYSTVYSILFDLVGALKDHVCNLLAWVVNLCTSVPGIAQVEAMHVKALIPYDVNFQYGEGSAAHIPLLCISSRSLTGSTSS